MGTYELNSTDGTVKKSKFCKDKWLKIATDLPVKISDKCCQDMKKSPLTKYGTRTNSHAILGTQASESRMRRVAWLKHGCNAFEKRFTQSAPLSFWTEDDILQYIKEEGLELCSVYGDIVEDNCVLKTTGCDRTGCLFCGYGLHMGSGCDRFLKLSKTHPKLYVYSMTGGQWIDNPDYDPSVPEYNENWKNWNPKKIWVPSSEGLGLGKVFDMANEIMGEEIFKYKC